MLGQLHIAIEIVRTQRFLEPGHVILLEHPRGVDRPLVTMRPKSVRATGVHHQLAPRANRVARASHNGLVGVRIAPPERSPTDLERSKSPRLCRLEPVAH